MPDSPIGKQELVKFYLILLVTCEINEVPVMRKLLCIFITLLVTSLPASGQEQEKMFFDEFGELYRTEGLLSDIERLLDYTKKIFSFKLAWDAPPTIRSYFERLDSLSCALEPDEMKEIIPQMQSFVQGLESEHPHSAATIIAQAELGYLGFMAGIDTLGSYSYKAYQNVVPRGDQTTLALYYTVDERRYARNPFVLLGDAMIEAGRPDYSMEFYRQAFPLDIYSKEYLYDTAPENIYHRIRSSPIQVAYKSMLSYPLQMWRFAKAVKLMGDPLYADYLNEAFRGVVERVLNAYDAMAPERQAWLMELYGQMFPMLYANPDPEWAYDAALFIKGCTNTIASDKFPGRDSTKENNSRGRGVPFYDQHMMLSCTYSDVANFLDKGEYAIEFLRVESVDGKAAEYDALLLSHSSGKPLRIHLCGEDELKAALDTPQSSLYGIGSKTLFNLVWQPLLHHIPKGCSIIYSPDGLLNMFALDLASDGKRRVAMTYSTHRVSSTREVCRASASDKNLDVVLYGGLRYEMTEQEMLERNALYGGYPGVRRGLDGIDRAGWADLPGSGKEVEDVAAILSSYGHPVRIMKGMDGTEESFKSLSGNSPLILHLATHGFYYDKGRESDSWYYESLLLQGSGIGPFVRSGLVLAGGQKAWLGEPVPDKVEDGILLSEEIAELDLSGTKFLTLSACETALGDVTPEGVTGLQAAFKRAGVGTMLMSLWKVDDDATREFMTAFYRSLCETGYYQDAIQAARRQMQSSSKYSNPYYWAGFVIIH